MLKVSSILIILAIFGSTECVVRSLPSFIESCHENDPELNQCIITNANKAVPYLKDENKKLKIIGFDPLKINEAILEPGGNLKLSMKNIDFIGLGNAKITKAEAHLKDGRIQVTLATPSISILGDYEIDGRIVILPIKGKGKANITTDNIELSTNINFKIEEKNGIKQMILDKCTVEYTTTRVYYHFGNLFSGDSLLATEMEKFLDENWIEIDKEFKPEVSALFANVLQTAISQIAKDVPYETIFLP